MGLTNQHMIPGRRIINCMTSAGEYLMIFVEYMVGPNGEFSELRSYNTITGAWRLHERPNEIKDYCIPPWICAVGSVVYMFGGESLDHDEESRLIYSIVSFDITNSTWKTVYSSPDDSSGDSVDHSNDRSPPSMRLCLLVHHSGSLYLLGRIVEDEDSNLMYKFCLETSTWSFVAQNGLIPRFKRKIDGTIYKNKLYCFGERSRDKNTLREIPIFDFSTSTWTTRAAIAINLQFPNERSGESYAFSRNFAYMSGGSGRGTQRSRSDIWRMDLETLEWLKLDCCLKTGNSHHLMSVVEDTYLCSFGGNGRSQGFFDAPERFTIRPPSLYRLCLEFICRSPNIRSYIRSLPADVVEKLNIDDNNSS
ncbi:Actin-fragmin kinase [Thelohanellus kitauei]|uniref:Actin-fragmin kinase n=1 Tax=Thelohanellus kitauei TaxID=669202 RepID=A0A0C2J534_THEKT|nr:Actin-fragmin kinase [Thelohanellus kitauei]